MQKSAEKTDTARSGSVKNTTLTTVVLRDLKIAYGLNIESELVSRFPNLKIFTLELNDLRGSDRQSFPVIISELT